MERRARRSGTGGRSGRQRDAAVAAARPAVAVLRRQLPTFDPLDEASLVAIETAAEDLLQEIGIEFRGDPVALDLWRQAGAEVIGERVRFPRGLLARLCATAPRQFTQHARNPARSVEIGGDHIVFAPAYGSPFVRDLAGGRHYGTLEDFHNFVKLAYLSPALHHSGGTVCEPVDVPVNKRHLDMVYAHLRWSDKPLMGAVTAPERAVESIELCRIAFGAERLERDCVILGNINVNSPLVYDAAMTGALRAYAAANQGTVVVPFILGGAMGPVTNAGAIVQAHAETMAGVALTQLVRPGAPAIYGNFLSSSDLRSGSPTFGTPEPAVGSLVVGQLARRLGLPLRCSGALTTAKLADGQAMAESMISLQAAVLSGANFVLHAAGWLEGGLTMGYEKFMIDADLCGAFATYVKSIAVDPEELALESFREVGPGRHFFGCAHTLRHYRSAYWHSELADNGPFEQWRDAGELTIDQRAETRWRQALKDYEAPPIDPATDAALRDFIERRKRERPDAWH